MKRITRREYQPFWLSLLFGLCILPSLRGQESDTRPVQPEGFSRVAALGTFPPEAILASAVIDSAAGFAYFGTYTMPGLVVKVRLSDFTRVGALVLNDGEAQLTSAVIDPAGGFAYFGTGTSPGTVVKVPALGFHAGRGFNSKYRGEHAHFCSN
jgi:hypothetical protein